MSSSGGVGGGNVPVVLDQGMIQFNGETLDPRVAAELEKVTSEISGAQLMELQESLAAWDLVLHGDRFVDAEDYSALIDGPQDAGEGDGLDCEMRAEIYEANGWVCPHGTSTAALHSSVAGDPDFQSSIASCKDMIENPTAANKEAFMKGFFDYSDGKPNVHELLFLVFKESIKETNEDKKYFLKKLKEYNDMAEGLSEYLGDLVEASQELSEKGEGKKYPEKETVSVDVKEFDLSTLGNDDKLIATSSDSKSLDRNGLNDTIKMVESMQETVRNKRQMASTSFQNFDQKSNQLYNLISSVMKSMNEMRSGTVRNML